MWFCKWGTDAVARWLGRYGCGGRFVTERNGPPLSMGVCQQAPAVLGRSFPSMGCKKHEMKVLDGGHSLSKVGPHKSQGRINQAQAEHWVCNRDCGLHGAALGAGVEMECGSRHSDSVWNFMFLVSPIFQNNQFSFLFFRRVVSMVILKMTETQAGEYLLFIQSEAANYTILFTVSIRSKCSLLLGIRSIPKQWFRTHELFTSCSGHNIQVSISTSLSEFALNVHITHWDSDMIPGLPEFMLLNIQDILFSVTDGWQGRKWKTFWSGSQKPRVLILDLIPHLWQVTWSPWASISLPVQ